MHTLESKDPKDGIAPDERHYARLLQGMLDSAFIGLMAFRSVRDPEGRIIDFEWVLVNAAAEAMIGRPALTLIGQRLLEEMPGNRIDGLFDAYVGVVESGEPWEGERWYDHDGIRSWFTIRAARLEDGFAVTFADITEAKRVERELLDSRELLTLALQAGRDGIWDWDLRTGRIWFSPQWKAQLGYADHEIPNTLEAWGELILPEDKADAAPEPAAAAPAAPAAPRPAMPGVNSRFGKPLWSATRIGVVEKIWGDGFTSPGGDDYIPELVKPLGLNPAMSVLDLAAGLDFFLETPTDRIRQRGADQRGRPGAHCSAAEGGERDTGDGQSQRREHHRSQAGQQAGGATEACAAQRGMLEVGGRFLLMLGHPLELDVGARDQRNVVVLDPGIADVADRRLCGGQARCAVHAADFHRETLRRMGP